MEFPNLSSIFPHQFNWCDIPAGFVTIQYTFIDHRVFEIPSFAMAQYPITNAQYQIFVEANDGYSNPIWWDYAIKAQQWRIRNPISREATFKDDDLPRTDISWFEAVAFCRWLSKYANTDAAPLSDWKYEIRLPTEQEWQRAAQGDDNLEYPWGNTFDVAKCNTWASGIGKVTPVSAYKNGASPYNVFDMAGNVWEWCLTTWDGNRNEINLRASPRVLRGGSYSNSEMSAGCWFRSSRVAVDRNRVIGFRIICTFLT